MPVVSIKMRAGICDKDVTHQAKADAMDEEDGRVLRRRLIQARDWK